MKPLLIIAGTAIFTLLSAHPVHSAQTGATKDPSDTQVQTIVCIRHGEKPPDDMGQLTPQGLRRALALPKVLTAKYGQPDFIFAPNPTDKDPWGFYYLRPLMTIEPTAIHCSKPMDIRYKVSDLYGLQKELIKPIYHNSTVFVAWEHVRLDLFTRYMVDALGSDPDKIPNWPATDYDSIFLLTITRSHGQTKVVFTHEHEGLNDLKP